MFIERKAKVCFPFLDFSNIEFLFPLQEETNTSVQSKLQLVPRGELNSLFLAGVSLRKQTISGMVDYYGILGVPKTASQDDIKKA